MKSLILLLSLVFSPYIYSQDKREVLKVSAIDWCPQICPNKESGSKGDGYLVELLREIFKESKYDLKFEYTPWSRAISNVKQGISSILLSPSKEEAPSLIYHKEPIGYQTHCFWKLKREPWSFSGIDSLKNHRIVIYRDHSYHELLNDYFNRYSSDNYIEISYDSRYIDRAMNLLIKKRATSFLFTVNSVIYHQDIRQLDLLEIDSCIKKDELWLGLSPFNKKKSEELKAIIDKRLGPLKKSQRYRDILEKYKILHPKIIKIK